MAYGSVMMSGDICLYDRYVEKVCGQRFENEVLLTDLEFLEGCVNDFRCEGCMFSKDECVHRLVNIQMVEYGMV